jgi:hypothetical protein
MAVWEVIGERYFPNSFVRLLRLNSLSKTEAIEGVLRIRRLQVRVLLDAPS